MLQTAKKTNLSVIGLFFGNAIITQILLRLSMANDWRFGIITLLNGAALLAIMLIFNQNRQLLTYSSKKLTPFMGTKALVTLLTVGSLFIGQLSSYFLETKLLGLNAGATTTNLFITISSQYPYFLVVVIIFMPVMQELCFRAILFGQLAKNFNWVATSIVSSTVYAWQCADEHFLVYWLLGMILCVAFKLSDDIRVTCVAHCLLNFCIIAAAMI